MTDVRSTALVTGASSGIGAVYADRLARRGHDLVIVARDDARLQALATRLRDEAGVRVEVLQADLATAEGVERVAGRLRDDSRIDILVNNAGLATPGAVLDTTPADIERLLAVNVTAVTRLSAAAAQRMAAEGRGAIVNISSVLAFAPEITLGVYGATKAFVLALSQSLQVELGPKGVYVQAVLPAATRTDIWARSGRDVNALEGVMEVDDLVDAALVGFDRREAVTIPPLPDEAQWKGYEAARLAMLGDVRQSRPAARYRALQTA